MGNSFGGLRAGLLPMLLSGMRSAWATSCPSYIFLAAIFCCVVPVQAQRQMENLTRGIVAVKQADGDVYVGWRLFGTDPETVGFNLYRIAGGGDPIRVNTEPISDSTNYLARNVGTNQALRYFVRPVLEGKELDVSKPAVAWDRNYLEIPIRPIPEYRPGDASIADLDGDGRAEMACKTADGTTDGAGRVIGDKEKDWRIHKEGDRTHGRILDGPEYFTIFDGQTGKALKTVDYIPGRDPIDGWGGIGGNGGNDSYGNRCDRFLACVAYLDGVRPSVVMCRGVYGRIVMAAWDWRGGELTSRWVFDSGSSYPPFTDASPYSGMGGHSLSVADVDADGKDEIVYHAMVVDDNGKGLYSTGLRHGDAMHISDMYPDRPGLEVFTIHENEGYTVKFKTPGAAMRDARTGDLLWAHSPGIDVGRGLAADIDKGRFNAGPPRFPPTGRAIRGWDGRRHIARRRSIG